MNDKIVAYENAFYAALQIDQSIDIRKLSYRDFGWDSVAHMVLMATLEETFDIQLETDDVIDFSSYKKGTEILRNYGVEL